MGSAFTVSRVHGDTVDEGVHIHAVDQCLDVNPLRNPCVRQARWTVHSTCQGCVPRAGWGACGLAGRVRADGRVGRVGCVRPGPGVGWGWGGVRAAWAG